MDEQIRQQRAESHAVFYAILVAAPVSIGVMSLFGLLILWLVLSR